VTEHDKEETGNYPRKAAVAAATKGGSRVSKTKGVLTGALAEKARKADGSKESVKALALQRKKAEQDAEDTDDPEAA